MLHSAKLYGSTLLLVMALVAGAACTPQDAQAPTAAPDADVVVEAETPAEADITEEAEITAEVTEETEATEEVEMTAEATAEAEMTVEAEVTDEAEMTAEAEVMDEDDETTQEAAPATPADNAIAEGDESAIQDNVLEAQQYVPQESGIEGETETHIAENMGFEFDYPEGWFATGTGEPGDPIYLTSFELEENGTEGIPEDETKIDFIPLDTDSTLNETIAEQQSGIEGSGGQIDQVYDVDIPDGPSGRLIYFTNEDGTAGRVFLTRVNEQNLLIAGYGDLTNFDQIILTLRSTETDEDDEDVTATPTARATTPSATATP